MVTLGAPWVLTWEINDGAEQDLNDAANHLFIKSLLASGAFVIVGAGPVCSSFSTAVRPPCRSFAFPAGKPDLSPTMALKVTIGNQQAKWVAQVFHQCLDLGVGIWVENPHASWLWKQRPWRKILSDPRVGMFLTDACAWGTKWRKRTRFVTNLPSLVGVREMCPGCRAHLILKGHAADGPDEASRALSVVIGLCPSVCLLLVCTLGKESEIGHCSMRKMRQADR